MKYFAAVALLFAAARAECPNACSGHGRCTNYAAQFSSLPTQVIEVPSSYKATFGYNPIEEKKDSCTCFTHLGHNGAEVYQWSGPDCSVQTCPYGPAFAGDSLAADVFAPFSTTPTAVNSNYHTQYLECSGQGSCEKGACQCYPGYEGDACQRTKCPNDCSFAGKCMTLMQIAEDVLDAVAYYYGSYFGTTAIYGDAFDREQSMACVCDAGRHGPDCSLFDCPSTADPMGGPGHEGGRVCSGRGACDEENGICLCHAGFFGTMCEKQRNKQA